MKPPSICRRECVNALRRADFKVVRSKGDHVILRKDNQVVSVPARKDIRWGTMKSILKQAGLSTEEFTELLKRK